MYSVNNPTRRSFLIALILASAFFFSSCHRSAAPAAKRYPFTGRVISIDAQSQSALIEGDALQGQARINPEPPDSRRFHLRRSRGPPAQKRRRPSRLLARERQSRRTHRSSHSRERTAHARARREHSRFRVHQSKWQTNFFQPISRQGFARHLQLHSLSVSGLLPAHEQQLHRDL